VKAIIADDEHLVRFSLKSMLEELGLGISVVAEAANGEDLLAQIARHHPDICFVDIRMPGLNGLAAIRKAREAGSRTRWIILTSHAEFEYANEAIRLGAAAYLLKPCGPANLAETLTPLLRQLRQERQDRTVAFERALIIALGAPEPDLADLPPLQAAWLVLLRPDCGAAAGHQERGAFTAETIRSLRAFIARQLSGSLMAATWLLAPNQIVVTAAWEAGDPDGHQAALALRESVAGLAADSAGSPLRLTGLAADGLESWPAYRQALETLRGLQPQRIILGSAAIHALPALQRRLASLSPAVRELGAMVEDFILARERGETPDLAPRAAALRDCLAAACGSPAAQQAKLATSPGCMGEQQAKLATSPGCMGEQQAKLATSPAPPHLAAAAAYLAFRTGVAAPEAPGGEPTVAGLLDWADSLVSGTRAELPDLRRAADATARVVERVENYLRQNLKAEVRVPDIARDLGLSPNYLSSVYHKLTACTISERLAGLRLELARELLMRPGSQVKEVAAEVGYKSTRHFAQLYRERYGQYPSGR
jgi:two-component system response regulator YesN